MSPIGIRILLDDFGVLFLQIIADVDELFWGECPVSSLGRRPIVGRHGAGLSRIFPAFCEAFGISFAKLINPPGLKFAFLNRPLPLPLECLSACTLLTFT